MGDIWFCVVIIIFEYFAQFVAHEQTRVTLVPLSENAFDDNFSAEELKMVLAQSGRIEFGLAKSKTIVYCNMKDAGSTGSRLNLRGEKRYQTCRLYFLDVFSSKQTEIMATKRIEKHINCETSGGTMTSDRANSSFDTAIWTFGTAYLTWSNMKFIIWLFLYCYILKYAVAILRDCRSINANIGNEENLHLLAQLKRSLSHLKTLLTKEDYSLRPKDPHSHKTTNIISDTSDNHSDISSESGIEISESEKRLASGSALIIPHWSSGQTRSSSLASAASFVRKSGGCLGLIYNFNNSPLYTNSSPNLNQNSNGSGEVFMQRPSMRNGWLKAQSLPSIFYVNKKKKWYSKGTINYVSSTSSKDRCKRWKLAERSAGGHDEQDGDKNIIDDIRDEGGTWQLNDICENQQQLNVTKNENSFHDMLKDIWTDIKVESHHQIIVPLLLHTAKTCFLEFGANYS